MRCWFGRHNWAYDNGWYDGRTPGHGLPLRPRRTCLRCERREEATYDMAYGGTIWSPI